jgi:hypothetical protein
MYIKKILHFLSGRAYRVCVFKDGIQLAELYIIIYSSSISHALQRYNIKNCSVNNEQTGERKLAFIIK